MQEQWPGLTQTDHTFKLKVICLWRCKWIRAATLLRKKLSELRQVSDHLVETFSSQNRKQYVEPSHVTQRITQVRKHIIKRQHGLNSTHERLYPKRQILPWIMKYDLKIFFPDPDSSYSAKKIYIYILMKTREKRQSGQTCIIISSYHKNHVIWDLVKTTA